ncbi:MAG: GMC family oxidoreductase [Myxococcales bacterium]|nr:GMC family oxidoreductase [Myxococcales bacterium]
MSTTHADVLVIGAGVAGGVFARRCVDAGLSVVCLEQGDWVDRADYPGDKPEWELLAAKPWSSASVLRDAPSDYPIDLSASEYGVLNWNGVGGGSILYNAQWPRMLPDDFRVRSVDGVAADWPLGYADLQAYYEATDRDFGVSGLGGNPKYPPGADPPLPPLPIGVAGLTLARAHARLGWHWWPGTNAILSGPYAGRTPCVQRGACGSGCNEGAKASADLTHWRDVVARGGRLVTRARVRRIVVDGRGLACGAEWVDAAGHAHFQPADVVVCAANGVGTPRLLLASDDLANSSGLVGRNLMLHPLASVVGLFDAPFDAWRAHAGALIHSLEFADSDPSRGFVRGATWSLASATGPLTAAFGSDGRGCWGEGHHAFMRERFGRTASWVLITEDLPDPENRVVLSPSSADEAGVPAPRILYRMSENSKRLIAWHLDRARESLEAAGAHATEVIHYPANGHLLGTARMGLDPETSVVDPSCRSHDVPNLVIPDGSVFVTAGSANPTTTIAALALRAADRLIADRAAIPRPAHRRAVAVPDTAPLDASPSVGSRAAVAVPADEPSLPTEAMRARLRPLADAWIPADAERPSASAAGAADAQLDRVLRARPDLAVPVCEALGRPSGPSEEDQRVLRYAVVAAYYLAPSVRRAMRYDPERVSPVGPFGFPEYVEEGLLDGMLGEAD